jgi:hypothetical protein
MQCQKAWNMYMCNLIYTIEIVGMCVCVLGSSPGEGGFCSSKTKFDRNTALRLKLFVSVRRLQDRTPQPWKAVLGSSSGENGFWSSETKHDRRTAPRPKLFVSTKGLQEKRPHFRKSALGSSYSEGGFCSSETKENRRTAPRLKLFVSAGRLKEPLKTPGFETRWEWFL